MLFCKEYYKINNATTGLVLTDAAFITEKTGKSQRRVWGTADYGFPPIYAVSGVEALAAGAKVRLGYVVLSGLGGGYDTNYDRIEVPIPQWATVLPQTTANDDSPVNEVGYERYDKYVINMPYPEGMTLCDGTVSKLYGSLANSYSAFVLYQRAGPACPPPRGGPVRNVAYDKGGDATTIVWNEMENVEQNAAGELDPGRKYRLLWGAFDAEAITDSEALMGRVTVPGYPPLTFCGSGGYFHPKGTRRIMFLNDSIMMRGDAVHKVECHIGTAMQGLVHLGWEDYGPV
jgi:hypothetical protein